MKAKIKYPYGQSNFGNLIEQGYHFVDKTFFIEELESFDESFIIFLRPRRFGKSLFVSMLEHYYGAEYEKNFDSLFGKHYIGQHPTSLKNSYWILNFNFSGINTQTRELTHQGFLENVKTGIKEFIHKYLNWTKTKIQAILKKDEANLMLQSFLTELNFQKHHPIYLLIDEYDHFTNELMAFDFVSFQEEVGQNGFVRKFYEMIKIATGDGIIQKIFITGVSPITMDSLTSGFNIGSHLSLEVDLNEMMGFTEQEVIGLLEPIAEKEDIPNIIEYMRKWYDGYMFNQLAKQHIYNSDMVLYFLKNYKRHQRYPSRMLDTNIASDYGKLRRLFALKSPVQNYQILENIVEGKSQLAEIVQEFSFARPFNENDFLSLLYYLGFLTIQPGQASIVDLKVPNYVIQKLYFDFFIARLIQQEEIPNRLSTLQNSMQEMAYEGNITPFFQEVERVLQHLSRRDYQKFEEKHVKAIIMTLATQVDTFFIRSEREYQGGYTDVVFLERPPFKVEHQYVLELKYLKKEDEKNLTKVQQKAKEQIHHYVTTDAELKIMKNLQAWAVIVLKDKVIREQIN